MNITDWFTEKLKICWHSLPPAASQENKYPQIKCFLLQAIHFLEYPSTYCPCNRKWVSRLSFVCVVYNFTDQSLLKERNVATYTNLYYYFNLSKQTVQYRKLRMIKK